MHQVELRVIVTTTHPVQNVTELAENVATALRNHADVSYLAPEDEDAITKEIHVGLPDGRILAHHSLF